MRNRGFLALAVLILSSAALIEGAARVTVPAGTQLRVRLESNVGSDISNEQDTVRGRLAAPVVVDGHTVVPSGSAVSGIVTEATRSAKVKGRARLSMRFTRLTSARSDDSYRISTRTWTRVAEGTKQKDAAKIALPAAGGAVIGALAGGGKGAAIGAAAGGGAGTAVVLATRGKEVRLGEGHVVIVRLSSPLVIEE